MQGFLLRIIQRRLRRLALGVTFGLAIVSTSGVAANRLHDANFDLSGAAAEKIQVLLSLAECGNPGDKTTVECEKHLKRAQDLVARLREEISAAAAASDGIGAQLTRLP